jgi:glycosyltransferase involved in cell wall biosynthesis
LPEAAPFPGHASLVRSVVTGLKSIGADFNFNPASFRGLARVVYAPANEALLQAAELKRRGRIDRLVAGPVNAFFPDECGGVLRRAEIDRIIVASSWMKDFYLEVAPDLTEKIRVAAVGVDSDFWKPSSERRRCGKMVLYWKNAPEAIYQEAERAAARLGFESILVRYGDYDVDAYRGALDGADIAIFLSTFETQGLALAEAWAMDVPTVVWDPRSEAEWKGRKFRAGSSCPYLTDATGLAFRSLDELETVLKRLSKDLDRFHPRAWVLAHMTDAVCARALHRILQGLQEADPPLIRTQSGTTTSSRSSRGVPARESPEAAGK